MFDAQVIRQQYSRKAGVYDSTIHLWKLWGLYDTWRRRAVRALDLRPGRTVLELGCGTGLNFPFLQEAVGQKGKIIGVDLTPEMLAQAQRRIERHGWDNVELIEADVSQFEPPKGVDGIVSTYAMSVIPEHDMVIKRCTQALPSGGRLVILDVKVTSGAPVFLTPLWMLLTKPFADNHKASHQEPWKEMRKYLTDMQVRESRLGFVYLVSGTKGDGRRGLLAAGAPCCDSRYQTS
jgi:demethylmenaquinone methyltransferase/2-methoxy-6-polyprenyl-1,4-benzoquinol methylase